MCREEKVVASSTGDIYQLAYAGPSLASNENEDICDKPNLSPKLTKPASPQSPPSPVSTLAIAEVNNEVSDQGDATSLSSNNTRTVTPPSPKLRISPQLTKPPSPPPQGKCQPPACAVATGNEANLHEHLRPLKISESPPPGGVRSRNVSPDEQQQQLRKWKCVRCTYENWPKAGRCVMCNASPRISPLTASPDMEHNASAKCIIEDRRSTYRHRSEDSTTKATHHLNNYELERRNNYELDRRRRKPRSQGDWAWLNACSGIVAGDYAPVHAYLAGGGDPARQLTAAEVALLNRSSAFHAGLTLVHLAIRFQREDILATLLSQIEGSGTSGVKRVPSYVAPDLASDIRRHVAASMRQRKSCLPCVFVTELATFTLPAEIEDLPPSVQEQLFEELLDKEAQQQLEAEPHPVINWSHEVTAHLYALWNRSAGDCLLDSLMQATWGVFDRENVLRRALADSLVQASHLFYPRWKEYEDMHASLLHFSLDEAQWQDDWASLVSLASQQGAALEQLHVFVLAHILRRPIIVYGVKYVKSFRGEDIGYARFEGVYLPFLWDPSFCSRSPLSLGYTRGHFSALIPIAPYTHDPAHQHRGGGARNITPPEHSLVTYLPLMDHERKLLPIHFVTHSEIGREEILLKQWLDVGVTESGLLVAQQKLGQPPLLVAQMVEEWLNHYRRLQQMSSAPFCSRPIRVQDFSSDESDGDE